MSTIFHAWLLLIVNVLAAVGAAWAAFVWFGKRWIEQLFAKQVEQLKHEQAKQLQEQRFKIDALFNRITKIHEREVEVLPTLWQRLQDALGHISSMSTPVRTTADLDRIPIPKLEEFLAASRLSPVDGETVRSASRKREAYYDILFWYDLADAHTSASIYHNYLAANTIFLTADLKSKFLEIDAFLSGALVDIEVDKEASQRTFTRDVAKDLHGKIVAIRSDIEELVQKRLRLGEA